MNEPYLIEGAVPQSLANLIRESKGEPATTKYLPAQFYSELRTIITSGRYLIKRASGAIASFNDAVAAPLVGLRVALPWRSEGYDSVEVTRCGKNLLNLGINLPAQSIPDRRYMINATGSFYISFSGENIQEVNQSAAYYSYTLNGNKKYSAWSGRNRPVSGTLQSIEIVNWGRTTGTFTAAQIELGSTPTAYEPYNGDTYTITLPTTIYGGYLDAVTGQLVATHDENGNLLTNQKLYFLPPTNVSALAGINNVWSDAGDVTVSYRVEQ